MNIIEFSEEQEIVFNKYIGKESVFITGPGGTGKSALIKRIYDDAISKGKRIQVCAMTGCAAILLDCKAKTIHSWAGIGIAAGENDAIVERVVKSFFKKKNWKGADILIIDEVSMMSKKIFEILDIIGRSIRSKGKPFGGIQVIFSGDFYQLPPIGTKEDIESMQFCIESDLWNSTFAKENQIQLVRIFRQSDPVYTKILSQIREGRLTRSSITHLEKYVGRNIEDESIVKPTKLFPTRNKVDTINSVEMYSLAGEEKTFVTKLVYDLPIVASEKFNRSKFTKEDMNIELQYIQSSLLCEKTVKLRVGCQVMCIINAETPAGFQLCNGSQGIITGFNEQGIPVVKFNQGFEIPIAYHTWQSDNIPGIGIMQIPLILAWALSIHKSQGASMDSAEIDVGSGIFECGQTYVALSRVRSLDGLYLTSFDASRIKINRKVREFYDGICQPKIKTIINLELPVVSVSVVNVSVLELDEEKKEG